MAEHSESRQFQEMRASYAKLMAAASGSDDPRLERAFDLVPREAFLPPGPWKVFVPAGGREAYIETPSADPIHLYHNILVALDEDKGLNNGQPSLHATWMGAITPKPGETVLHIGAGRGYYSAILSILVLPEGRVIAFEIDQGLAAAAKEHLKPFDNAEVVAADAVEADLPEADIVYVNAGVTAPPAAWLRALRPAGRLIFPWRPSPAVGMTVLITKSPAGFVFKSSGRSLFTPCIGAFDLMTIGPVPDYDAARRTRSVRLTAEHAPDTTATAVYKDVWFSDEALD